VLLPSAAAWTPRRRPLLMRVACLTNMNNSFFALVRFLRDRGIDADLLLTDIEFDHFVPAQDTYDDSYRDYTVALDWGSPRTLVVKPKAAVRRDLAPYDAIVGCGYAPAHVQRIGRRLDVFAPYGADLYLAPWAARSRDPARALIRRAIARRQRAGIRSAREIFLKLDMYAPYREALNRLGVPNRQAFHIPIYYPEYDRLAEGAISPQLEHRGTFDRIRAQHDVLVFSPARHMWRSDPRHDGGAGSNFKGNDVLLRGVAGLVSAGFDVGLITFEYGPDVAASRALAAELGIEDRVHWLPLMPRRELMYGILASDFGADQFPDRELGGAFGGATIEMMVMRLPVLGRMPYTPESWQAEVGYRMPPIVNVRDAAHLTEEVAGLLSRREELAALGSRSRQWVIDEIGSGIDDYVAVLGATDGA
jgi:glycosyltransferase involved in cell wall biosynthesis